MLHKIAHWLGLNRCKAQIVDDGRGYVEYAVCIQCRKRSTLGVYRPFEI